MFGVRAGNRARLQVPARQRALGGVVERVAASRARCGPAHITKAQYMNCEHVQGVEKSDGGRQRIRDTMSPWHFETSW